MIEFLSYVAVVVGAATLLLNLFAYRKKTRRRMLYLLGVLAAAYFTLSYALPLLGVVELEILIGYGVLRWGVIMAFFLLALHALIDV